MKRKSSRLPSPIDLDLPPKYKRWRDAQVQGIEFVRASTRRVRGLAAPTGSGKGSLALGLAKLWIRDNPDARILILTETKGLQAIYESEGDQIKPDGLVVSITGAGNYVCHALESGGRYDYLASNRGSVMCDKAPCAAGLPCKLRDRGCTYYGSDGVLQRARDASIVVTNYANWFSAADIAEREEKFGEFDLLIADESHGAVDALCNALAVEFDLRDIAHLGIASPNAHAPVEDWTRWAGRLYARLETDLEELQSDVKTVKASGGRVSARMLDDLRRTQRLTRQVSRAASAKGEWIVERKGQKVAYKPVWPDRYCESHLLRGIPDAVFMSATLVRQDLRYLGLDDSEFDFMEMESTFPVERRPVYVLPCARMRWDMSSAEEQKMIDGHDAVIKSRPGWRGITHSVSYARAVTIKSKTKHQSRIYDHASRDTIETLRWFKEDSPPDAVVLTPVMHTGIDLPDDQCRFQVLVKIPFPDTRDPIVKARVAKEKKYLYYAAMRYIRQCAGRPVRHDLDYGELWILDSNALWFFEQAREFMDDAFAQSVKIVHGIGRQPKI